MAWLRQAITASGATAASQLLGVTSWVSAELSTVTWWVLPVVAISTLRRSATSRE